jgi:hypothetical protein
MTLGKWIHSTLGRIVVAAFVVAAAIGGYALMSPNDRSSESVPDESAMVEDAVARQAGHERDSVANIISRSTIQVRRSAGSKCVEIRNRKVETSSSYCYALDGARWKLRSERVGTR